MNGQCYREYLRRIIKENIRLKGKLEDLDDDNIKALKSNIELGLQVKLLENKIKSMEVEQLALS